MKAIWKLSMGRGAAGGEFSTLADVHAWVAQGLVLVRGPTGPKGGSRLTQGEQFRLAHNGDVFYLCHGNDEPGILLLGEFVGHADLITVPGGRDEWYGRRFREIEKARTKRRYDGPNRWWAPSNNSTFVEIPEDEYSEFETAILKPYFGMTVADLLSESAGS
jgi:hypothetical protein